MKKIFLIDKGRCTDEELKSMSEHDLDEWAANENYAEDYTIMEIYPQINDTIETAICRNMGKFWWDNYRNDVHIIVY